MKREKVLSFDIGGTKTASAIVTISGKGYEISDYKKDVTPQDRAELVEKIADELRSYGKENKFSRIGLAVAGQVDLKGEKIVRSPNIPYLDGFSLGREIAKRTGLEVVVRNDVRAFALGEDRFGASYAVDNALYIAPGTGIGGAIKVDGQFYFGHDNIAGEIGHMVIVKDGKPCTCGRRGCWERYFSGPAIEESYEKAYGHKKAAKDIVYDALHGQAEDGKVMMEMGGYFAAGLSNLINIFNPDIIVLGGSVFKEKGLLKLIAPAIREEVLPSARKTRIVNSSLGDKAFLLGAALK